MTSLRLQTHTVETRLRVPTVPLRSEAITQPSAVEAFLSGLPQAFDPQDHNLIFFFELILYTGLNHFSMSSYVIMTWLAALRRRKLSTGSASFLLSTLSTLLQ